MKRFVRTTDAALMAAVLAAIGCGVTPQVSMATPYAITTSTDTLIEASPYFGSTTVIEIEGATSGGTKFRSFGVFDFNASNLGLAPQTQITAINSASFNLTDLDYSFAKPGTFNVFVSTNNSPLTGLSYQTSDTTGGIGTQLATLTQIGTLTYAPGTGGTTSSGGSTTNTSLNVSLNLSSVSDYLKTQLNTGGNVRIVVATPTATAVGDFVGPTGASGAPSLSFDLATAPIPTTDAVLTVNGGTKSQTIVIPRIVNGATSSTTVTLTNSGTGAGTYNVVGSVLNASTLTANGVGAVGVDPVPGGGTSNITVGIAPFGIPPGSAANATVTVRNQSNSSDGNITITIQAQDVVASRIVDANANSTLQFGKVLAGTTSAAQSVLLGTDNTNTGDFSSNGLTTIELLGNTTVNSVLQGVHNATLDTDTGIVLAGTTDVTFDSGSKTTNRNVQFTAGTGQGGLYQTKAFYDGFVTVPLTNLDSAIGANANPFINIYMEADVYQQASVSGSANGTVYSLTNALHTANVVNTTLGDIGARAGAQVTSVSLTGQAGFSLASTLSVGATIADGASVVATNFDSTAKWNGVYTGSLKVGLQNDQSITGATPNDLGNQTFAASATVAGNSGNASVNVLANGSFAGYSIPRGSGKNSTVSLLAGTSTAGNTISAAWANGTSALALSDQVTLTRTAGDKFVVQMTYDPTGVTTATANSPELAYVNGSGVNVLAAFGNSNGGTGAGEVIGAFDSNMTLGHYGIDPVAHTVWAVVDHIGAFEAFQRKVGDATGDGTVDLNDLNTVLNNLGVTTALWSQGNFDGATTIDLNDLNAVLNNLGTSLPAGANSVAVAQEMLEGFSPATPAVPEPTSLGIAGLGAAGLLLRRKSRAAR